MKKIEERINHLIEQITFGDSKILLEQVSHYCSKSERDIYKLIFNENKMVKYTFMNGINDVLKSVYPENYYEKDEYSPGQLSGVYDLESYGRSLINKLNTHYGCFCILINDINFVLSKQNKPPITIIGKTPHQQVSETKKLIEIINDYKTRIFNKNSSTFINLMKTIGMTHNIGEKNESIAIEKMKGLFGEKNVKKVGKLGSSEDAIGGVDCEIKLNERTITGQIKPYSKFDETINDGIKKFIFRDTGQTGNYTTNWLIFVDKKTEEVFIFKNDKTEFSDGDFMLPESSLIYVID